MEVRIPVQAYMVIGTYSSELLPDIEEWFIRNRFHEGVHWWFDFDFNRIGVDSLVFEKRRIAQLFHLTWCTFPL